MKAGAFFKENGQKLLVVLVWAVLVTAYLIYAWREQLSPLEVVNRLVEVLRTNAWGPLLYIVIYGFRPILLFSAALLTIAGGLLFGPIWGWLYATIGANLGAMLAYAIGRVLGKGVVDESKSGNIVQGYTNRMRDNAFSTVLTMRFLFLPYDLVNYMAGFLRIEWRAFLLASFLGSLPGSIAFILFGASLQGGVIEGTPSLDPWTLAASVAIFGGSLVLARLLKQREAQDKKT